MSSNAVQEFLQQAQRSGLFDSAEAQEAVAQLTAGKSLTTPELSDRLVEQKLLTAYQAELLLAGRGDECLIAGRYRVLEKLGAGGMGAVLKALDTRLDRIVAIKVMGAEHVSNPDAVARFQREARALAKVSHPAIVEAHDVGEDRGRHFIVMEYVAGTNLKKLVTEQRRIAPTVAADYVYQAALGLQHAHRHGLVHRDLKPANLLLTPAGRVKILDLGLARLVQDQIADPQLTREGTALGTPDYMAPEQFGDARHVDHRADIYALGCTLYHLLAGRMPFPGTSLSEKAHAHETAEAEPLAAVAQDIPAGLILVVERMMAKKPGDRFQSACEVAEALAPHVSGSSASLPDIKRTTTWQGSQLSFTVPRRRRRRTVAVAVAASVILALVAVVSFLAPGLLRKEPRPSPDNQAAAEPPREEPAERALPQEPPDPNVLTVSKDANDGGQFRTINEALTNVSRPGMTIRVLDDATYAESVVIDQPEKQTGIRLEAPKQAVIQLPAQAPQAIRLKGVPDVHIHGFRFRESDKSQPGTFILVDSGSAGAVLEHLDIHGSDLVFGVTLQKLQSVEGKDPVIVRNCAQQGGYNGIVLVGTNTPCQGIVLSDNRFSALKASGILIRGTVGQVLIAGNVSQNCRMAGVEIMDLAAGADPILMANNTVFGGSSGFSVVDFEPFEEIRPGQLRLYNNLLFEAQWGDWSYSIPRGEVAVASEKHGKEAAEKWTFANNWRDLSGQDAVIPLAAKDRKFETVPVLSRDPDHADFLRPSADSPLASGGAGHEDPALPTYVGAVPPEGVPDWDWDKTWRWLMQSGEATESTTADTARTMRPGGRDPRRVLGSRAEIGQRDPRPPFFLWLRLLAMQKLVDLHRRHLGAKARDASRRVPMGE